MPTYHKIEINMDTVNVSLQVGDVAYKLNGGTTQQGGINYANLSGEPVIKLGTITKIEPNCIYIKDMVATVSPEDVIMYKSFCEDEDAILRVGQALEISKEKADLTFFSLSMSERCFEHSEKKPGLIIKDIHTFKSIYGLDAIVYKIQTNPEETGYILFMSAAHVGV